jgi:hypothetical protein
MFDPTNLIPQVAAAKTAIIVGLVVALFSGGLYIGYQWGSKALPEAQVAQQIDFTKTLSERWQITSNSVPIYIKQIEKVKGDTQLLLTQVPVYVKDHCPLSPNLRVLHDLASQGQVPDSKRDSDADSKAP